VVCEFGWTEGEVLQAEGEDNKVKHEDFEAGFALDPAPASVVFSRSISLKLGSAHPRHARG